MHFSLLKEANSIEWEVIPGTICYDKAIVLMHEHVNLMLAGKKESKIILLEHENVYTIGSKADSRSHINNIPLIRSNRGGATTYHGPGQRIIYPILDLTHYRKDVHWYLDSLEKWIIAALKMLGINAEQNSEHRGVWVQGQNKIASIGVRFHKWITLHGCAVNISTDMKYFEAINPCDMNSQCMTSCHKMGYPISLKEFDNALYSSFNMYFA
jgi:lipoyl(octanoyl) transferase